MALKLGNAVIACLQQNPEQKFTAREIAKWILDTYPEECRQKQERSTATVNPLDNEAALLQQIASEIGSQRPQIQKRQPKIKTTEGHPRKYYFTESTDSAEIDRAEGLEASNRLTEENKDFLEYVKLIRQFHQTGELRQSDWDC